jgi:hypothetical protein
MLKTQGAHWHCANRDCGWSVVLTFYKHDEVVPRCVCGGPLTRSEMLPVFSYLDFLRGQDSPQGTESAEEE